MLQNKTNQYYYSLLNDEVRNEFPDIDEANEAITDEDKLFHFFYKTNPYIKQSFWKGQYGRPTQIPMMANYL